MANAPSKLSVEQQLLVSAVADEITETTSIHQQAIVRMLAVASEHDLNAANLLQDLGVELKSAAARRLPFVVEDLQAGMSAEEALARTPGVVPQSTAIALAVAQSKGLQKPLNYALLNTTGKRELEDVGVDDFEAMDQVIKLAQKYIFVVSIFTFMMLFIIPQFKQMFEEFGVELPFSMQLLIEISNKLVQFWFLLPLIMIVIGIYFIIKHPRFFTTYITRWIPSRWNQPVLTKQVEKELSLAWVVQTNNDLPKPAMQFLSGNGIATEELGRVAATEKSNASSEVLQALTTKRVMTQRASTVVSTASSSESTAWILRAMSKEDQTNRRRRGLASLRIVVWIGEFFVMFISAWAAYAIFQSLILIIEGLTDLHV